MGILECWKSVCIKYNVNLEEYYAPDMYVGVERFETRCFANFAYSQKETLSEKIQEMALQYVREIVPMVTESKLKITFYHPVMKEYNGYGLRRQD